MVQGDLYEASVVLPPLDQGDPDRERYVLETKTPGASDLRETVLYYAVGVFPHLDLNNVFVQNENVFVLKGYDYHLRGQLFREKEAAKLMRKAGGHPNVASSIEEFEAGQYTFFVFPRFHNDNLCNVVDREGSFSPIQTLTVVRDVADGLEYMHDLGMIHRDVKPENILLDAGELEEDIETKHFSESGIVTAAISDFGFVYCDATKQIDDSGIVYGTQEFIPIENWPGESRKPPTPQTDVYALGITAYELLLGDNIFPEMPLEDFHNWMSAMYSDPVNCGIPKLRIRKKSVPVGVEEVVMTAISPDTATRFRTPGEFAASLEEAVKAA